MEDPIIDLVGQRGKMAVAYLAANSNPDGSFNYCVDAGTGAIAKDYNILRHAGTLLELCEWTQLTGDHSLVEKISKGISYLLRHLQPLGTISCIVERDQAKLGGSALALLALCSYYRLTGDDAFQDPMKRLAGFIVRMQAENGDFQGCLRYSERRILPGSSRLYAGEALLALVEYHSLFGGREHLLAARRSICFEMVASRNTQSTHAWLARGLMTHYSRNPEEEILLMIHKIGINAIKILYGDCTQFTRGIVREEVTTTAKAVSIGEALIPFLEISLLFEEAGQLTMATKALQKVLDICFGNQIVEDRFINGLNLFGGLINSKSDHRCRIDFVQHFLHLATNMIRLSAPINWAISSD